MFQENEIRFQLKSVLQLDMLFWPALEQLATILDKSPGDSTAIFIFFSYVIKTVQHFRNFFAVLPPSTPYKVETRKKILDTRVEHCLWGEWRG